MNYIKLLSHKDLFRVLMSVILFGVFGIAIVRTLLRLIPRNGLEYLETRLIGYEGWSAAGLIFTAAFAIAEVHSCIRKRSNILTIGRIDWICYFLGCALPPSLLWLGFRLQKVMAGNLLIDVLVRSGEFCLLIVISFVMTATIPACVKSFYDRRCGKGCGQGARNRCHKKGS